MRATRKDIIRALKKREMTRINEEIERLTKNLIPIPSFDEQITARGLAEYKKRPAVRKLLKALTDAKIEHKVTTRFSGGSQGERDLAKVHIDIEIPAAALEMISVRMTEKEYKQVNNALQANNLTNGQIAKLRSRYNTLNCDDSADIIDDVISQILIDGDDAIKPFLDKVSAKLTEKLESEE